MRGCWTRLDLSRQLRAPLASRLVGAGPALVRARSSAPADLPELGAARLPRRSCGSDCAFVRVRILFVRSRRRLLRAAGDDHRGESDSLHGHADVLRSACRVDGGVYLGERDPRRQALRRLSLRVLDRDGAAEGDRGGCAAKVVTPAPPPGPPVWGTAAGTCVGEIVGTCSNPGEICAPVVPPPPPGFAVCIGTNGDRTCPDEFSDRRVFYDHFDDSRMCSACACSTPSGGTCTGTISTFEDGDCSSLITTLTITSTVPTFCVSVPPGIALGSKSAGPLTHVPGTCQASGGEAVGSADPVEPSTFCCRP